MIRLLSIAGAVAGAVGLSQFPEFSQQYLQRLAGQVDALTAVTADFDASAQKAGLDREAALASMEGTEFLGFRQEDMRNAFSRHENLQSDLTLLRAAGPIERVFMPQRFADPALLDATWADFQPAVPTTTAGLTTAAIGFVAGWGLIGGVLTLLSAPFRRRAPR
jgi:hypothetical protein